MASASTPKHSSPRYLGEIEWLKSKVTIPDNPRFLRQPPEAISIKAALEHIWREKGVRFVHHRVRWVQGTAEHFTGYPLFQIDGVVYGCTRGKKYPEPRRTAKRDYSNNCRRLPGRSPKYD